MKYIDINNAAMDAIRGAAEFPLKKNAVRLGLDLWRVPVQEDTLERMEEVRLPAESYSDLILRVVALAASGGRKQ